MNINSFRQPTNLGSIHSYGQEELKAEGKPVGNQRQVQHSGQPTFGNGSGGGNPYFQTPQQEGDSAETSWQNGLQQDGSQVGQKMARLGSIFSKKLKLERTKRGIRKWTEFNEIVTCGIVPFSCPLFSS